MSGSISTGGNFVVPTSKNWQMYFKRCRFVLHDAEYDDKDDKILRVFEMG